MRALDMRDDLEKQVMGLSKQRDTLEADIGSMATMQQTVKELVTEVRLAWIEPCAIIEKGGSQGGAWCPVIMSEYPRICDAPALTIKRETPRHLLAVPYASTVTPGGFTTLLPPSRG